MAVSTIIQTFDQAHFLLSVLPISEDNVGHLFSKSKDGALIMRRQWNWNHAGIHHPETLLDAQDSARAIDDLPHTA